MNRKLWSNNDKVAIVLAMLRGDESAAVIYNRYGVSAAKAGHFASGISRHFIVHLSRLYQTSLQLALE